MHEWSLYANYIEAFTQGPTAPSNALNVGQIFAPFRSKQYEVGTKLDLGHISFGLSAFQITVPNGITDPDTHIFGLYGEQRNRGLELIIFGEMRSDLRILGGMTLFDARQTETAGHVNDRKFVIGVPKIQMNLAGEWDVPMVSGLTLTARVLHTTGTFLDGANRQPVSEWTRLDVGARYATALGDTPLTLHANVTNALNNQYWEANPTGYLIVAAPLTARLSATADF